MGFHEAAFPGIPTYVTPLALHINIHRPRYINIRGIARLEINHCKNPHPKMSVFLRKVAVCMIKKKIRERGLFCFASIGTRSFTHEIRRRYLLSRASLPILVMLTLLQVPYFLFSTFFFFCICRCDGDFRVDSSHRSRSHLKRSGRECHVSRTAQYNSSEIMPAAHTHVRSENRVILLRLLMLIHRMKMVNVR